MTSETVTHEILRAHREDADISQEAVAYELGCSVKSIQRFERGERPLPLRYTLEDYDAALVRIWERRKPR